ncbi:Hsp20/alpha crystallin family protein [Rhodopseudomonas sp. HC1]|uniref:Hsp20/alpha crystallin family protein n=1 Tax=Rhodopseudomonas infernalis TaxID=2897386 RepID=UPI001EE7C12B|nr:Hsp20/alpha crystallin family protein [Rhodopseudomonas infernalis]MCG6207593.1 Hsp20/alpha crystallin family protein [Rhodopseudomonas infernalis]
MNMREMIPWGRSSQSVSPFNGDPFVSLQREMNRLFDDVFRGFDTPALATRFPAFGTSWPKLEIADSDKALTILAEVPGLAEKDIEVLLDDGALTIRGEKTSDTEDKDKQFSEHFYGRFERRIPLNSAVAADKVSASFKNGLLTVTLPKAEPAAAAAKRIAIQPGK